MSASHLLQLCFAARDGAHVMHLRTTSYAAHKALDTFYHELVERVDAFAEAWQGVNGPLDPVEGRYDGFESVTDPGMLMKKLRDELVEYRDECCGEETELENLYDALLDIADTTRYLLRLK